MKEILFRGLSVNGNKWVYGHLMYWAGNYQIWETEEDGETHNYLAKPESIGQFTGLLDKKGKKIFEGDRVKAFGSIYDVVFNDGAFYLRKENIHHRLSRTIQDLEVIGNIHE